MGQTQNRRSTPRRGVAVAVSAVAALALSGCATQGPGEWSRLGLPERASAEGEIVGGMWTGVWIAAMAVGVLTWGLILFAAVRYRKRNDELPPQTRFNLPIEALYTIAPLFIIGVLFFFTAEKQEQLLNPPGEADHSVEVIGQQWSWTFNHTEEGVSEIGTAAQPPTLVLPVDQSVDFVLNSPDVIHSFWVPAFYMKMDVIPGRENTIRITPDRIGSYVGKCAELCGAYHARMTFDVEVVSQADYDAHIAELQADPEQQGIIDAPLRGAYSTEPLDQQGGNPEEDQDAEQGVNG